jgi:hypothetical protein
MACICECISRSMNGQGRETAMVVFKHRNERTKKFTRSITRHLEKIGDSWWGYDPYEPKYYYRKETDKPVKFEPSVVLTKGYILGTKVT